VVVVEGRYQLVGITALGIAMSMMEETNVPSDGDIVHWTNNAYPQGDVAPMRAELLRVWYDPYSPMTSMDYLYLLEGKFKLTDPTFGHRVRYFILEGIVVRLVHTHIMVCLVIEDAWLYGVDNHGHSSGSPHHRVCVCAAGATLRGADPRQLASSRH
jgi:hypothetical protein